MTSTNPDRSTPCESADKTAALKKFLRGYVAADDATPLLRIGPGAVSDTAGWRAVDPPRGVPQGNPRPNRHVINIV